MAEPTDDKNSEHGAGIEYAAGNLGTPDVPYGLVDVGSKFPAEEAPADTVMQRLPNLVLNQSSANDPLSLWRRSRPHQRHSLPSEANRVSGEALSGCWAQCLLDCRELNRASDD